MLEAHSSVSRAWSEWLTVKAPLKILLSFYFLCLLLRKEMGQSWTLCCYNLRRWSFPSSTLPLQPGSNNGGGRKQNCPHSGLAPNLLHWILISMHFLGSRKAAMTKKLENSTQFQETKRKNATATIKFIEADVVLQGFPNQQLCVFMCYSMLNTNS